MIKTREQELGDRRLLLIRLRKLSPKALLTLQFEAMTRMEEAPSDSERKHWAAHEFINVVSYRSFGKLDAPCRHRDEEDPTDKD
jgi:hypothetical protein